MSRLVPILLLCASNVFMTIAWYGHLRHKDKGLLLTIFVAWMIALPEYMLQVPANRMGHSHFTAPQLKLIQEAISITAFIGFSILYLRELPKWTDYVAFAFVVAGLAISLFGRIAVFRAA